MDKPKGGRGMLVRVMLLCGLLMAGSLLPRDRAEGADWLNGAEGYAKAMEERRASGRAVAVYFYVDWCGYCRHLGNDVLSSGEVESYLSGIIGVRLNPEDGEKERAIADQYGVSGYPSFFILPQGNGRPVKIRAYRKEDGKWILMAPSEFVRECQEAGKSR